MTRKTNNKINKMQKELEGCFQTLQYDTPFFRSVKVSYVPMTNVYDEKQIGWHVKVMLNQPFIQDLYDLFDISYALPDNVTSYVPCLLYDTDGVFIVYSFRLKDWYDGRDS